MLWEIYPFDTNLVSSVPLDLLGEVSELTTEAPGRRFTSTHALHFTRGMNKKFERISRWKHLQ